MSDDVPERRKWFQFRLRSLLIAVLVLSLPLSWFAVRMDKARRQKQAVSELAKLGNVKVLYECQDRWPLAGVPAGPIWLRKLLGDDYYNDITYVDISNTRADDATLLHLKAFPRLRFLRLDRTLVTDEGLRQAGRFKVLEDLYLPDQATTEGLGHIAGPPLRRLVVPRHFTDEDLTALHRFPNLELLDLSRTTVTDAGLEHLRALRGLQDIDVSWTRVTEAGRRSLPYARIIDEYFFASTPANLKNRHQSTLRVMGVASRLGGRIETFSDLGQGVKCEDYGVQNLDLSGTKVTDSDLTLLDGAWIRNLDLSDTDITHLGSVPFARADGLIALDLSNTEIGDADLECLSELRKLDHLSVRNTRVTPGGVEKLKQALPYCAIDY